MEQLKENFAKNMADLRKAAGMTQLQLAEHLSYSDKAVSKWERGESLPDVLTLKHMSTLFGVTIDQLLSDGTVEPPKPEAEPVVYRRKNNRRIIVLLSVTAVWFAATVSYTTAFLLGRPDFWELFLAAVPISWIVVLVFNAIWGSWQRMFLILTALLWTLLLTVYCFFLRYGQNIWILFILGVPAQFAILLWRFFRRRNM